MSTDWVWYYTEAEGLGRIKIVSGCQTGVDRAALDAAIELGVDYGGWIPKGRRAEDGPIAQSYRMQETPGRNYATRTALNVRDSEVTLILSIGPLTGGSALTRKIADRYERPCLHVDLDLLSELDAARTVLEWLGMYSPSTLNVAGPRESTCPGIYARTHRFMLGVLSQILDGSR